MKKNKFTLFVCSCLAFTLLISCEKELPVHANFSAYSFSGLDDKGGTWSPILLSGPDQIVIPNPQEVNSAAYQEELTALRSKTANLSGSQKEAVKYWTNNPIVRWNEIALEMAAKYNIIPGPNADGTYSIPDPENPGKYPQFPFAHPPYASRAFAYLSVAQFDGLISAWHYKFLYNRKAPYLVDNSIHTAYDANQLPSYPSDGAVVAIVSREILTAMFPLEKEFLAAKAEEHLTSLIWAGINVPSDISAGEQIGTEVAKLALARAANDGMKNAQAPKEVSDSIKASAFKRFGWQWDNMEEPVRPVGLAPLFGKVKMWNVPTVEEVRPGPPPAPGSAEFNVHVQELKELAKNVTEERRRIANWWQDGLGTYTPPGHWNKFAKNFIIQYKLNPLRSARVLAYMNMAIMDAGISCWDTKYYYHYPRPIQTIQGFKTIAGTPNFPGFTSGHSTFSAAAAEVLSYFFPNEATKCKSWAEEAAESRIYGGLHFRFDSEVGLDQGKKVAKYSIDIAKADGADF